MNNINEQLAAFGSRILEARKEYDENKLPMINRLKELERSIKQEFYCCLDRDLPYWSECHRRVTKMLENTDKGKLNKPMSGKDWKALHAEIIKITIN